MFRTMFRDGQQQNAWRQKQQLINSKSPHRRPHTSFSLFEAEEELMREENLENMQICVKKPETELEKNTECFKFVCLSREVAEHGMREFRLSEREEPPVLIIKMFGEVHALQANCPNCEAKLAQGCLSQQQRLLCPMHGSAYDIRTGALVAGVGFLSMWVYECRALGGNVFVKCPLASHRRRFELPVMRVCPRRYDYLGIGNRPICIVGAGIAAISCALTLREKGYSGRLVLICREHQPPYDRKSLSKRLCEQQLEWAIKKRQLDEQKKQLVYETSPDSLLMSQEYLGRLHVLRALNYIDKQNMVGLKGKVACEISNQELLLTELILDNKFNERSLPEIAAMLSTLTCQFDTKNGGGNRRNGSYNNGNGPNNGQLPNLSLLAMENGEGTTADDDGAGQQDGEVSAEQQQELEKQAQMMAVERVPSEVLRELKSDIFEAAARIDTVQKTFKVVSSSVTEELKFGLMEVVYQWASGMEFSRIMRLSDAQEGIIVRCIQRLDEVCKDVRKAALIVGSPELADKMEEVSAAIRRDIVFAASLYVTE